jgi:hypothetical protein
VLEDTTGILPILKEKEIRHLIYLLHANISTLQAAVRFAENCKSQFVEDTTVILMPRPVKACSILFNQAGLLGDMTIRSCPLSWIPLDDDVISLEIPGTLRSLAVDDDRSCLYTIAYGLHWLQQERGSIKYIKAKGQWANSVYEIMKTMRQEAGTTVSAVPTSPSGGIQALIMLDRTVDMISPMATQLTYEGLLDEIMGLAYGQVRPATVASAPTSGSTSGPSSSRHEHVTLDRKVTGLNSTDPVFVETRDLFYLGARKWLNDTLRSIQQFRDSDMAGADIVRLKGFVSELRDKFSRIPLHASLVDQIGDALKSSNFAARQRLEASFLDEDDDLSGIEDIIAQSTQITQSSDGGLLGILRLLIIYSAVHGGIPKRQWDLLRREIVNTFGPSTLTMFYNLSKARLLHRRDPQRRSMCSMIKSSFNLLMPEIPSADGTNKSQGSISASDLDEVEDIHYVYAGYAPLSVRIVQHALVRGWSALSHVPGPQLEVTQSLNDDGLAVEAEFVPHKLSKSQEEAEENSNLRTVMILFIGGVTRAEISALRFLSRRKLSNTRFVVATTEIVNGNTLLEGFMM